MGRSAFSSMTHFLRQALILLCLLAAPSGLLTGCAKEKAPQEKLPAIVSVETVQMSEPQKEDTYSAVVTPREQIDVAFKAGGYVDYVAKVRGGDGQMRKLQEGDFVKKGTVLARLRSGDYLARVHEATAAANEVRFSQGRINAGVDQAKAALDQAQFGYDRASSLFQSESLTKPDFDAAKANLEVNQARLREAKAQIEVSKATQARANASLEQARLALGDTALRAPIDGVITKRSIEEGSLVGQGAPAFSLAESSTVKVAFGVPDVDLSSIQKGKPVTVTTEAIHGRTFTGQVTEIAPAADPRSRVFNVEVTLPNPDRALKLGMIAALKVGLSQEAPQKSLTVPLTSVVRSSNDPNGYSVFVVREQGGKYTAEERRVKLGEAVGQLIAVKEGLHDRERVVTTGSTRIVNGEELRITN